MILTYHYRVCRVPHHGSLRSIIGVGSVLRMELGGRTSRRWEDAPLLGLVLAANYVVHPAVHRHGDCTQQGDSHGICATHCHPQASSCCPHSHSHQSENTASGEAPSDEPDHSHCELCDGLIATTASPSWSASEPLLPTPSPKFNLQSQDDWTVDPSLLSSNLSRRGPPSPSA